MPRRRRPDPLAQQVGKRIRELREEADLTLEKLGWSEDEEERSGKGHLSNLERGLAVPTVKTLQVLADRLGVALVDLVNFPASNNRAKLIEFTRKMPAGTVKRLLKEVEGTRPRRR
jgi:transcriptional regulator with XRE-family HTH domain